MDTIIEYRKYCKFFFYKNHCVDCNITRHRNLVWWYICSDGARFLGYLLIFRNKVETNQKQIGEGKKTDMKPMKEIRMIR